MKEKNCAPVFCNTGVTNTTGSEFRDFSKILIDWLQVTFYNYSGSIFDLFNYLFNIDSNFVNEKAGGYFGYTTTYYYKNILILYNEYREDMGYHLYVTGGGCRDLEDFGVDYKVLFSKIIDLNCHFTRLDVSIDLFNDDNITFNHITSCLKNNEAVGHFRFVTNIEKTRLSDNKYFGHTIYFGSRTSLFQLVFYDKLAERLCNGFEPISAIKSWVRVESRLRDKLAFETAYKIATLDNFSPAWLSVLSYYIDFKIYNSSDLKNRYRWSSQKWWSDFLLGLPKLKLSNVNHENDLLKTRAWLEKNVSRSQFVCFVAGLDNLDCDSISSNLFYEMLKSGLSKITDKDVQLINDYRIKNNLGLFTKNEIVEYFLDLKRVLVSIT